MVGFARKRRRRLGDSGQALVEFAIIVPILLIIVMGIVDFGRAFYTYHVLIDAAREGARVGVVANPTTTIDTVANRINTLLRGAGLDTARATKSYIGFGGTTGVPFTVNIAYPYHLSFLQPFFGWTNAQAGFTLNTNATFRNE